MMKVNLKDSLNANFFLMQGKLLNMKYFTLFYSICMCDVLKIYLIP